MSAAAELYQELSSMGVAVWQDAGRLRYRAPARILTAEHLTAMKAHKPDLLALLTATRANDTALTELSVLKSATATQVFILTYEIDGQQATCRDPVSATLADALAAIRKMYGQRLGRVWCQGKLVTHEDDAPQTGNAS